MKNIIVTIMMLPVIVIKSQVAIGKAILTNNSVSLEFSDAENRGMILPYVEDKSGIVEDGTVIYDMADKKVKYLKDGNWFDLSVDANGQANAIIQGPEKIEKTTAKTAIGVNGATDTTQGILVLTDTNKAMILPKVASPHLNIINPSTGMMVYDTTKKQLAVYNGTVWSFWKP